MQIDWIEGLRLAHVWTIIFSPINLEHLVYFVVKSKYYTLPQRQNKHCDHDVIG